MEAADASTSLWTPAVAIAVGATVAAVLLLGVALYQRWRLGALAARAVAADAARDELSVLLAGAPFGMCRWGPDGERRDAAFEALLAEGYRSVEEAIAARFGFEDAEIALARLTELREDGVAFDLNAGFLDGSGAVALYGRRTAGGQDVLWIRDCGGEAAERARLKREAASTRREADGFRDLLDALPLPVWRRRPDLSLEWCNAAFAAAVESGRDDVLAFGRELGAGSLGDDGLRLAGRAQRSRLAQSESHHVAIKGARRLIDFNEVPLGDGQTVAGFAQDMTDLEATQAELSNYIAAYGEVLERLRSAIAIYGPDRRLRFFNHAFAELWGLSSEWLATEPPIGDVMENLRERRRLPEYVDFRAFKTDVQRLFNSLLETREELLHLPDGSTLRESVSPHPQGGLLFIYEDFTDRLELERQYNTLIAVQRQTLNNLHEALAVFGSDGRLKLSNPAFAKLWGFEIRDLEGEPHVRVLVEKARRFFPDDADWPRLRAKLVGSATEAKPKTGRMQRADDTTLDYASIPLPDGACIFSYVDRTDSVRIEQALVERNEALLAADRLKTQFIANVSYELRTPLNAILGFAELLSGVAGQVSEERRSDYAEGILSASQRLAAIINDILDLATIEGGYMSLTLAPVDVPRMLESVRVLTRERARERDLELRFERSSNLQGMIADEKRLRQVLFNLISNAIQHSPQGGEIQVDARRDGDEAVFSVTDRGRGIAQGDQQRVFGMFERAGGRQSRGAGAGLGLALVKRFIELHGGRVGLASKPGEGTTVTCHLPLVATPTEHEDAAAIGAAADD